MVNVISQPLVTNANIDTDNGLSPVRRQAIVWTNAALLSIGTLQKP